jgi:hypothetical protein
VGALEDGGEGAVLREYAQTKGDDPVLTLTHTHLPDGSEIAHDVPGTDEHTFNTELPGDAALARFGRYGDVVSFEGGIDEFLELWARVKANHAAYMQVRATLVEAGKAAAYGLEGPDGVERIDRVVFPRMPAA